VHESQPVPIGQAAVEERHVHAFEHNAGLGQRTCLPHHPKVRLSIQQFGERLPEVYAVVHHQDTQHAVHYTDVEGEGFRSLKEGERVSYEPATSRRGARRREEAKEVRRVLG
jgi:cold shock CspA family protein